MAWYDDLNNGIQSGSRNAPGSIEEYRNFIKQQDELKSLKNKNTSKPKGNFLSSLLPTGGGIGGALSGAAAGAALGSVATPVGTAVGGLIGAILGGAGGSALGKVGQNAVEGEQDLGKGVLGEALLGGATSTPIGAGFKLLKAGVKVATGIGKKSASDLIQEAGVQTIGKGTVRRGVTNGKFDDRAGLTAERLGFVDPGMRGAGTVKTAIQNANPLSMSPQGRLQNAGNKALLSQYGTIGKPTARSTDPLGTISALADAGLTKPSDVERVGSLITGSSGLVTKATANAVGKAGGVDTTNIRRVFEDAADNYGLVEKDRASIEKVFSAQSRRLNGGALGLGRMDGKADPTDALSVMKSLEKRIANLTGKGENNRLSTPEREDQANVLRLVKNEIEDQLYAGAGANANLSGALTPKLRGQLIGLQPNNAQWQNYVDNKIMGSKTVGELRSSVAPFVKGGKIIEEGNQNSITMGGRVGNAFNTGGIRNMIGEAATGLIKNPASRFAGNTLRSTSNILPVASGTTAGALAGKSVGQGLLGLSARQSLIGQRPGMNAQEAPQLDANGLTPEDLTSLQSNPLFAGTNLGAPESTGMDMGMGQGMEQPQGASNPFGISLSDVAGQLQVAIQRGDSKGYATLSDLYDKINDFETKSANGGGALGATAKNGLASSANAINTLDQLEGMFGQAGGGGGRIGGAVQNLLGGAGLNNNVDLYNTQAGSTVTQLAKALNGGGQVTDADARVVIDALPKVTDNPEVAAQKFAALRQRLQVAAQNTAQFGGGSTDLSSILAQYGQ